MGFFDKLLKKNEPEKPSQITLKLSGNSRRVSFTDGGDDGTEWEMSFMLNEAFREAKSHAAEVPLLFTYAPDCEFGTEGDLPCVTIQFDDDIYCAVEEYKENGDFTGSIDLVPLGGALLFKAKMEYGGDMMYFYGLDRCGGFWENNGLCLLYPKSLAGTEDEKMLMAVLDEAAESYAETAVS